MKKLTLSIVVSLILRTTSFAQVTVPTNISPFGTPFVGWNGLGVSRPLQIRNDFNEPITMSTTGTQHLYIANGSNAGRIGIGPSFSAPQSLLHLNTARDCFAQFTNGTTGAALANGFLVGVADGGASTAGHAY